MICCKYLTSFHKHEEKQTTSMVKDSYELDILRYNYLTSLHKHEEKQFTFLTNIIYYIHTYMK